MTKTQESDYITQKEREIRGKIEIELLGLKIGELSDVYRLIEFYKADIRNLDKPMGEVLHDSRRRDRKET